MESPTTITWYVCHGNGAVHFIELNPGSVFESGQPNIETFSDKTSGLVRAKELGYIETEGDEE